MHWKVEEIRSVLSKRQADLGLSLVIWIARGHSISKESFDFLCGLIEKLHLDGRRKAGEYLDEIFTNAIDISNGERGEDMLWE